ncbi:putative bifunctional diguanylate cyclase/phosphodiesterase [Leptolyngbya iicbica]|uniref:EAL domain-containing protein n=2 Tax=Cyanophyceae TaxID=3028117 RepID=A0A4Q7E0D8_9CYAN|nr:GGDEF domain-containing phosphodiesterase [Leptolyngbya sp. LK]RZM74899.1 EAL domain-containing protein [Leptolyngbya sp. LK]
MNPDHLRESLEALKISERRRQETQRLSGVGFWELDHKHEMLYWSEEIYAIYGLDHDALKPDYGLFLSLIYDDDRALVHQTYQDSVKLQTEYCLRYRIKAADSVKWIEARGVTLYDQRGQPDRSIGTAQDVTEIVTAQQRIEHLAYHDALTNLPNRKFFADRLHAAVQLADRDRTHIAVLFIDLDDFKRINDRHGHDVGDEVLVGVAQRLQDLAGPQDIFARIGGDEFAGVLSNFDNSNLDAAVQVVKRALEGPYKTRISSFDITASIGVTLYPQDRVDPEVLLRHSDQAMYEAKENGKSQICFFDTERHQIRSSRRELLNAIATAINQDELMLYYQPRVNLRDGSLFGAEALLRWFKDGRFYSPKEITTAIRDTEWEWQLDNWVMGKVIAHSKGLRQAGIIGPFGVNLNPKTVENEHFPQQLSTLLTAAGVAGKTLEIEVLEVSSIKNFEFTHAILSQCRAFGVSVALDDFGTGYSSLTHFHALPIDTLKIDQRFIKQLNSDPKSLALVKSILAIAQTNNRREVVAEGIESYAIAHTLKQLGCAFGQGYGFARPMPVTEYVSWVQNWNPSEFQARLNRHQQ